MGSNWSLKIHEVQFDRKKYHFMVRIGRKYNYGFILVAIFSWVQIGRKNIILRFGLVANNSIGSNWSHFFPWVLIKRGILGVATDILKILEPEQKQKPRAGPESLDDMIPTRKKSGPGEVIFERGSHKWILVVVFTGIWYWARLVENPFGCFLLFKYAIWSV